MPVTLAEAATPNPANTNLWYQWQTDNGAGGPANNNIPDATNATYAFTPANSNANYSVQFQVVVTNVYGAVTSSVVAVAVVPVPTNGQWTACYQMTNASQPSYNLYGSGSYTGTGVLGTNGFWNPVNGGAWNSVGPFTSASDYEDNGSTHSGITCTIGGQSFVGGTQSYSASDVRGLLSQFVTYYAYSPNAIVFSGVPNGTYNLALHGTDGQWGDHGTTFTVHGANGDQTAATTNKSQYQYFVDKDTTVIITNVQVSGGTLNVDVTPTSPSSQCQVDAVEIQLVSLSAPSVSTDVSLSYLALDPLGALTPTFNTTVTNYTANEANGNSLVTVTVTNTSSVATNVLFLNGAPQATNAGSLVVASLPLVVGSGNMIQVVVTAQDGVTTSTNTVTVTRAASSNALLASLTITPAGTLAPAFASGTTSYNATNTYVNNPVTVTATSADGTATLALSLNGGAYGTAATGSLTSGSTNLLLNPPVNTVAVQVVSQDLSQTNVYTVNVLLQPSQSVPKLTNSVSGNNLVLSWPADHLGYRLLVQTNNLNKGVSGNINDWGTVSGSQSITATNLTIIKTGVTNQYYKLVYP
jgi:hypothetical protein